MTLTLLLQNLIFEETNPLPFETGPHSIHTIPLLRNYLDSYLYYLRYKTYEITPSQTEIQVNLNSVESVNTKHETNKTRRFQ